MRAVFLREAEAWAFLASIADAKQHLLLEAALAYGIGALIKDQEYVQCLNDGNPLDLYMFTKTVYAFLEHPSVIQALLDGSITDLDQLNDFSFE